MNIFEQLKITVCEECIGDGACAEAAPETFEINDDVAVLTKESTDSVEDVMAAAEACPIDIITIFEKSSGKQLYP